MTKYKISPDIIRGEIVWYAYEGKGYSVDGGVYWRWLAGVRGTTKEECE